MSLPGKQGQGEMQAILGVEDGERMPVLNGFGSSSNQDEVIFLQELLSATLAE